MTESRCLYSMGGCVGVLLIVAALLIALFARKHPPARIDGGHNAK